MQTSKSLRPPIHWQDFETLCKKLWGEIWNCPEIKKNGRSGQEQFGVDVSGIPYGEKEYIGIQCKGKDQYSHKQFNEGEILTEIGKAKNFKPALKKLYFATTAVKDAKIEEFIRIKNIENQKVGLFEIHIYCWEDIVDLIDENKQTYNWYINSQNYKGNNSADITFDNGETDIIVKPKFKQHRTVYGKKIELPDFNLGISRFDSIFRSIDITNRLIPQTYFAKSSFDTIKTNLSFIPVKLKVHNTGTEVLEDYKIDLTFKGEIVELANKNANEPVHVLLAKTTYRSTTYVDDDNKTVTLLPTKNVLVHDDSFFPATFYIKPSSKCEFITIHYKLLSRNFKEEGDLTIYVQPEINIKRTFVEVDEEADEKTEFGEIEDFIEITGG